MSDKMDYEGLLLAIRDAEQQPERRPGVFTRSEIEDLWGLSYHQTNLRLRRLMKNGSIKPVREPIPDRWGIVRRIPAYQIVATDT